MKNIGNIVAAEMANVLESKEYKTLFSKAEEPKEQVKQASIEVEELSRKERFNKLAGNFLSLSKELDEYGLNKTASFVLTSFELFLKEASGDPDKIEQMMEEALSMFNPNVDVDVDFDVPSKVDSSYESIDMRLMGDDDDEDMMEGMSDLSLEDTLRAIEDLGLEAPEGALSDEDKKRMKERGLGGLSRDISRANKRLDLWLKKHALVDPDMVLMNFADNRAKRLVKGAGLTAIIGGSLALVSAIMSGVNHFGNLVDQGALKNANRATEALDAITDDLPQLNSKIAELTSSIEEFKAVNKELTETTIELNELDEEKVDSSKYLLTKYEKTVKELSSEIKHFIALTEAISEDDSSVGSTLRDWGLGNLYDFGKDSVEFLFTANDVKQAVQALRTLDNSIHESLQNLKKMIIESKKEAEMLAKDHKYQEIVSKDLDVEKDGQEDLMDCGDESMLDHDDNMLDHDDVEDFEDED